MLTLFRRNVSAPPTRDTSSGKCRYSAFRFLCASTLLFPSLRNLPSLRLTLVSGDRPVVVFVGALTSARRASIELKTLNTVKSFQLIVRSNVPVRSARLGARVLRHPGSLVFLYVHQIDRGAPGLVPSHGVLSMLMKKRGARQRRRG